jgi:hypothetical protein
MRPVARPTPLLAVLLVALALAACSDGTAPDNGEPFTTQQTAEVGAAASDEATETATTLVVEDAADPSSLGDAALAAAAARPTVSLATASLSGASLSVFDMPPACATRTPSPPQNPDGDAVPTDVTVTFDPSACTATSPSGVTVTLFGSHHVTDPFPTTAGFDRDATIAGLGLQVDSGGTTLKITRNGTRQVRGSANGLNLTQDISVLRQRTGRPDVTVHKQGAASFTPDAGETLVVGEARPSGTIALTGTVTYAGRVNADFTVQTITPLHYAAGCADLGYGPARRIDAGELRLTRTVAGVNKGYLRVVWSACGQRPTYTFVPNA